MKITIYTVSDCKFSQSEKEYLTSKGLQFEEKNLETNRDFLTEMLQKSNNFSGTPVTEIVKDDGSTVVIKGFTQSEFDAALGTGATAATPAQDPAQQVPANEPAPQPPVAEPEPVTPPAIPANEPQMPQTNEAASAMSVPVADEPVIPQTAAEPVQPAMPDMTAGQVLSDNLSAPINSPGTSSSFSAEPPSLQTPPVADATAGIRANPAMDMPMASEPQANPVQPAAAATDPAQPAPQTTDPLKLVLGDLQARANS